MHLMRRVHVLSLVAAFLPASRSQAQIGTEHDFSWLGNSLGVSAEVPKPWTPVEVDGTTVRVWGREIRYDRSLLPTRIASQGAQLLAGPVTLDIRAGGRRVSLPSADVSISRRATTGW